MSVIGVRFLISDRGRCACQISSGTITVVTQSHTFFADVDHNSAAKRSHAIRYLDGAAANQEMQRLRAAAYQIFAPTAHDRLLDAGCGLGEVARQLGAAVGNHGSVVALDRSAEMISIARSRHNGTPVTYQVGDITSLEFPDGHFSGVRSERVLQHLADPDAAIRELARVTRPGGRVCVIDTDWSSLVHHGIDGMDHFLDRLQFTRRIGKSHSGRMVRARMVKAGLDTVDTFPLTLRFTTPEQAAAVVILFDPEEALASGLVPADVYGEFWAAVTEAAERNEFLIAFTMWISQGRVPSQKRLSA